MDILGIGFPELIFIFIIALMVLGPRRLPEYAAKAGKIVRDLRNMYQGLMTEWQREITVATRIEELEEARQELEEAKRSLNEIRGQVTAETTEVEKSLKGELAAVSEAVRLPEQKEAPPTAETATESETPAEAPPSPQPEDSAGKTEGTEPTSNKPPVVEQTIAPPTPETAHTTENGNKKIPLETAPASQENSEPVTAADETLESQASAADVPPAGEPQTESTEAGPDKKSDTKPVPSEPVESTTSKEVANE